MYDLHCHLLPGIDDGPDSLEQALALAQCAVDNGITHSVVTPHIHLGRYDNHKQSIATAFAAFQQALSAADIDLQIGFAGEVRLGAEILDWVMSDHIPYLGTYDNQQVLLLELPHSHVPPGCDKLIDWLLKQNIVPMIAHPERNKDIMRDYHKLSPFVEQGCLFQLTAGSVAGFFGRQAQLAAEHILQAGHATILASDAHNINHRPPSLTEGLAAAAEIIGQQQAHKLVFDTPQAISQGLFDA